MVTLGVTVGLLVAVYVLQQGHPWVAGFVAVIPVKIVAAGLMAAERSRATFAATLDGLLAGQLLWAGVLLGLWIWIRR